MSKKRQIIDKRSTPVGRSAKQTNDEMKGLVKKVFSKKFKAKAAKKKKK